MKSFNCEKLTTKDPQVSKAKIKGLEMRILQFFLFVKSFLTCKCVFFFFLGGRKLAAKKNESDRFK